jgi:hypothetical protein
MECLLTCVCSKSCSKSFKICDFRIVPTVWYFFVFHFIKIEKSEGTIKNEQSRDTGNIGHKTRNGDKQEKKNM